MHRGEAINSPKMLCEALVSASERKSVHSGEFFRLKLNQLRVWMCCAHCPRSLAESNICRQEIELNFSCCYSTLTAEKRWAREKLNYGWTRLRQCGKKRKLREMKENEMWKRQGSGWCDRVLSAKFFYFGVLTLAREANKVRTDWALCQRQDEAKLFNLPWFRTGESEREREVTPMLMLLVCEWKASKVL